MKKVYRDKQASVHWSAARNEERPSSRGSTADKPVICRGSTAGFVPPSIYIGFRVFVLPKTHSGKVSAMLWRRRGTVVSGANRPVGVPSCPASFPTPPRRALPAPTRPWYPRVLDSTNKDCMDSRTPRAWLAFLRFLRFLNGEWSVQPMRQRRLKSRRWQSVDKASTAMPNPISNWFLGLWLRNDVQNGYCRRPADKPIINRWSTGGQPLVFFLRRFT